MAVDIVGGPVDFLLSNLETRSIKVGLEELMILNVALYCLIDCSGCPGTTELTSLRFWYSLFCPLTFSAAYAEVPRTNAGRIAMA